MARRLRDAQTRGGADDRDLELAEVIERLRDVAWPEDARPSLAFHLNRLERSGLVVGFSGGMSRYGDRGDVYYTGRIYAVTPTVRRLMHQLTETAATDH